MFTQVRIPNQDALADVTEYSVGNKGILSTENHGNCELEGDSKGGIASENRIVIETKILHEGEVNKARFMPQKYNVIATKGPTGEVHIFDYSQHPATPVSLDHIRPEVRLLGHSCEGFDL